MIYRDQITICNNMTRTTVKALYSAAQSSAEQHALKGLNPVIIDQFEKSKVGVTSADGAVSEAKHLILNILMGRTPSLHPKENEFDKLISLMASGNKTYREKDITALVDGINGLKRGIQDPVIRQSVINELKDVEIRDLDDMAYALERWNMFVEVDNAVNNRSYPITGNGYKYMQYLKKQDSLIKEHNAKTGINILTVYDGITFLSDSKIKGLQHIRALRNALDVDPLKSYIMLFNPHIKRNSIGLEGFTEYLKKGTERFKTIGEDGIPELHFNDLMAGYDEFEVKKKKNKYLTDYLYEKYYLPRLSACSRTTCKKILDDFGVRLFVGDERSKKTPQLVYDELSEWKTKSRGKFNVPPLLDISGLNCRYIHKNDVEGYYDVATETIHLRGEERIKKHLRHEMFHANDDNLNEGSNIINGIDFNKIAKRGAAGYDGSKGRLIFDECLYRDEFLNAGIAPGYIYYAYTNPNEFKAVAVMGDCSRYSPEFKTLLVKLGLKPYILEMKPCAKDVVERADRIAAARKQGKSLDPFWQENF